MARQKHSKGSSDTPIDLTTASLEKESPKVSPPFPKNYPEYPGKPYVRRARKLKSSCTLYKLPFEIRDMIFQLTLDWTGQTPRMLLALRQEPALYAQALKVFRQNNIYEFKGLERSCKMSLNAIQTIERLLLKAIYRDFHPLSYALSRHQIGPNHWNAARNWTMNLKELRLYPNLRFPEFIDIISVSYPITDGHLFPKLNKLAFHSCDFLEPQDQLWALEIVEKFVGRLNQNLGVNAKLESVLVRPAQDGLVETAALESDVWFWQAPVGKSFARMAWELGHRPVWERPMQSQGL